MEKARSSSCEGPSVRALGLGSTVVLSGTMTYDDRPFTFSGTPPVAVGLGNPVERSIRFAKIGVIRCDGAVLGSGFTDSAGRYSVAFINTGTAGVVARVWAETDMVLTSARVLIPVSGALHQADSPVQDDSSFTSLQAVVNFRVSAVSGGGAFNILDVLTSGSEFVKARTGGKPPPLVTVYWAPGNCDGTFFNSDNNSIHLLGGGVTCAKPDPDEYDDAVIFHEYGHFIAANVSKDDSPGGRHELSGTDQDLRLAWSEGWATFIGAAIRDARGDLFASWYVDTGLSGSCVICLEIEGPSKIRELFTDRETSSNFISTSNEVAVSVALWDVYDPTPLEVLPVTGVLDSLSAGIDPIWTVVTVYLPCGTTRLLSLCPGLQTAITTVSMEDFWDGLISLRPTLLASALIVARDRKMEFFLDGYEPDDTLPVTRSVSLGQAEHHTLYAVYPKTDTDLVALPVTQQGATYEITTQNLTNGADTFLEVLNTSLTVLAPNDDDPPIAKPGDCGPDPPSLPCPVNGSSTLASRLLFTAPAPGTYYIRVSRSPSAPPSAGVYGSYDLLVTSTTP